MRNKKIVLYIFLALALVGMVFINPKKNIVLAETEGSDVSIPVAISYQDILYNDINLSSTPFTIMFFSYDRSQELNIWLDEFVGDYYFSGDYIRYDINSNNLYVEYVYANNDQYYLNNSNYHGVYVKYTRFEDVVDEEDGEFRDFFSFEEVGVFFYDIQEGRVETEIRASDIIYTYLVVDLNGTDIEYLKSLNSRGIICFNNPKALNYTDSEDLDELLEESYNTGFNNGWNANPGYNRGYEEGISYQKAISGESGKNTFVTIFESIGSFFAIELLPGISFGLIIGIPFVISVAWFVIKQFRGGA